MSYFSPPSSGIGLKLSKLADKLVAIIRRRQNS
jgi:hypothetical protein